LTVGRHGDSDVTAASTLDVNELADVTEPASLLMLGRDATSLADNTPVHCCNMKLADKHPI